MVLVRNAHRYVIAALFVVLALCLVLAYVIYDEARQRAIEDLTSRELIHAHQAKDGIEDFFRGTVDWLSVFAGYDHISDLDQRGMHEMDLAYDLHAGVVTAVTRADENGVIEYSTPDHANTVGVDISNQVHMRRILRDHVPVVSDVFQAFQGYPAIAVHVPVYRHGLFAGTIGVLIDFEELARRYLESIRLGETGYAWVISAEGIELYCPVPGHVGRSVFETCAEYPSIIAMAERMVQGLSGSTTYTFNMIRDQRTRNVRKHAVYLPVYVVDSFWSIVVASSQAEVLANLISFRNNLAVIAALLVLSSGFFSYYAMKTWGVVREAAERERVEQALRESRRELAEIFNMSLDLICIADINSATFLRVNPAFTRILGYTEEELLARSFMDFIHPDDVASTRRLLSERLQRGDKVVDFINRYKAKDGSYRWIEWTSHPIPERGISFAVAHDITDRREADLRLQESEQRFRELFDNMNAGVAIYESPDDGETFIFKDLNRFGLEASGLNKGDAIGRDVREVFPGVKALGLYDVFRRVWRTGRPEHYPSKQYEDDRITLWVENYVCRLPSGELVAIYEDTTAQRQAEESKRILERQVQQAQRMESIGNLAGGIAHDFNNILFPIIGLAELLLEDLPEASPEHESIREILHAGQRGSDLVAQILAFSRQSEHKLVPVRPQHAVKEALKLARSTIPSNITVKQDVDDRCSMVLADPTQLHQIVMNLVTNAYHAVERLDGSISVSLRETDVGPGDGTAEALPVGRYALLTVSDTGCGIPADDMEKIFEPYFTTKEQGKGTGLGLAVVFGIVKEHRGDIKVESTVGSGTTFRVYLPLVESTGDDESVANPQLYETGAERILVVDDEAAIARLECRMLERLGYSVEMRDGSVEALELFRRDPHAFDLVITDMTMPNMTGDQLAAELLATRPDIPIVICTGFSERMNWEKARSMGIKGFLMKPIVRSDLAEMVRQALDST